MEDKIIKRILDRIYEANEVYLRNIGEIVGSVKKLTPTQAQQLVQILKYGGSYEEIVKQIEAYTNLNIKEIDEIFSVYAKNDQMFYEKFYRYRNIPFVGFEQNMALQTQTRAIANIVKNEMYNFTRSNVLGYIIKNEKGVPQFYGLKETYNRVLNEALLNVGQGKETYDQAMGKILEEIGGSGLKTLVYDSTYIDKKGIERHRSMRLDSAINMHLKSRLRELHNENQKLFGKEFGADGVEISVHDNPAPDHALVQGRQFSIDHRDKDGKLIDGEYEKLQGGLEAKDYKGNTYTLDHDGKNGYRPISEMNCYHYIFSIILGASDPEYTDKQLKKINEDNEKGFEIDGKHYTNYQGEQMQRTLERKIREQKDLQILGRTSNNEEMISKSQKKITELTNKYKELSQVSGLRPQISRARVSGYRRKAVK